MATQVQLRRGTTAEHSTFTGAVGEITVDISKKTVVVHDGATPGGFPAAREGGSVSFNSVTLSGGTANGVAYLNATKVLTSGSGLQFDGANLGVGVAPSAWESGWNGIEFKAAGSALFSGGASDVRLTSGAYYNTGWKYAITGSAVGYYFQTGGQHIWYTAPSGTAGNPITFTQAMTLDASGNLLVGTTTASQNLLGGANVIYNNGSTYQSTGHVNGTGSGVSYHCYSYNGSVIGSISQSGTTAVAYNTTSDHRLKENVRPANAARFNDIEFVDFEWIDGRHDCGVIAHQLQAIYPDLVLGEKDAADDEGKPVYQQVNYIGLIGRMGTRIQIQDKQLQAQSKLIESLEARLAALEAK